MFDFFGLVSNHLIKPFIVSNPTVHENLTYGVLEPSSAALLLHHHPATSFLPTKSSTYWFSVKTARSDGATVMGSGSSANRIWHK